MSTFATILFLLVLLGYLIAHCCDIATANARVSAELERKDVQ
jgi:hypothetical protein